MSKNLFVRPKSQGTLLLDVKDSSGKLSLKKFQYNKPEYVSEEFYNSYADYFEIVNETKMKKKLSTDGKIGDHDKRSLKRHLSLLSLGELFEEAARVQVAQEPDRDVMVERIYAKRINTGDVKIARIKYPSIDKIVNQSKPVEKK